MAHSRLCITLLILSIFSTIARSLSPGQDKNEGLLIQQGIVTEFRETTITVSANLSESIKKPPRPCRSQALEKERAALFMRLKKPTKSSTYTHHHIRYRLLSAIDGFLKYADRAEAGIERKREMMKGFSVVQLKVQILNKATSYDQKLSFASEGIQRNAQIAREIADYAMSYYEIEASEVEAHAIQLGKEGKNSDHTSITQSLKHFVRDWSADGEEERAAVFPPILETLEKLFPDRDRSADGVRVLIPGSGVGRLAADVDELGGFEVHTNEYSAYMNLATRYLASLQTSSSRSLQPYVDTWSHQPSTNELFHAVSIPDTPHPPNRIVHHEGDFTTLFKHYPKFDVVITLFFIDTARNLLTYFETIKDILKPGGKWINVGPLFYGSAPMVELCLDEVVGVVREMGFLFEDIKRENGERWGERSLEGVRQWEARYGLSPRILTKNSYLVQYWVVSAPTK